MAKPVKPQFATGNDLLKGDVIYFIGAQGWSRAIGDAEIAVTPEAAASLLSRASAFPNQVVGVYLADAALDAKGRAQPAHFREAFRMRGPSNYHHGKQAEERTDV